MMNPQIIVFVNEGQDGTPEWLAKQKDIDYLHSPENVGICYSMNLCRPLVKSDYVVYLNDDMYVLTGWDRELFEVLNQLNTKKFMLSASMVEPHETGNPCVLVKDYGDALETFKEEDLLNDQKKFRKKDWFGATWPPNIVHVDTWDLVGGLSPEFSPGMYSDPDFSKKLYDAGVRIFKGVGSSFVYHFGCKSTGRVKKNKGHQQFLMKWGISSRDFTRNYLHLGKEAEGKTELLPPLKTARIKTKFKLLVAGMKSRRV